MTPTPSRALQFVLCLVILLAAGCGKPATTAGTSLATEDAPETSSDSAPDVAVDVIPDVAPDVGGAKNRCDDFTGHDLCLDADAIPVANHVNQLQSAIDQGGRVLLLGVFELGVDGFLHIGRLDKDGVAHDLELGGEPAKLVANAKGNWDAKGKWVGAGGSHDRVWPTQLHGGGKKRGVALGTHLLDPLPKPSASAPPSAPIKFALRHVHLDRAMGLGLMLLHAKSPVVENCAFTDVLPHPDFPSPPPGLSFAIQIGVGGKSIVPATDLSGQIVVRDNFIDMNSTGETALMGNHQAGVVLLGQHADSLLERNVVLNAEYGGLAASAIPGTSPATGKPFECVIRNNHLDSGPARVLVQGWPVSTKYGQISGFGIHTGLKPGGRLVIEGNTILSQNPGAIGIFEAWGFVGGEMDFTVQGNTIDVPNVGIRSGEVQYYYPKHVRSHVDIVDNTIKGGNASVQVWMTHDLALKNNKLAGRVELFGVAKSTITGNTVHATSGCKDVGWQKTPEECAKWQGDKLCQMPYGCYCDLKDCGFVQAAISDRPWGSPKAPGNSSNVISNNIITGSTTHGITLSAPAKYKAKAKGLLLTWPEGKDTIVKDNDLSGFSAQKTALYTAPRCTDAKLTANKVPDSATGGILAGGKGSVFAHTQWPEAADAYGIASVQFVGAGLTLVEGASTTLVDSKTKEVLHKGTDGGATLTWADVGIDNKWKIE